MGTGSRGSVGVGVVEGLRIRVKLGILLGVGCGGSRVLETCKCRIRDGCSSRST